MVNNFSAALLTLLGVIFVWLVVISVFLYQLVHHYRTLTKRIDKKDLKSILEKILKDIDIDQKRVNDLHKDIQKFRDENAYNIQKIGLVRFNPFAETGGDQSFSLAILDETDSGCVVSSLHSRNTTRLYAKPVKNGKAVGYDFSTEETQAVKSARRIK